MSDMNKIEAEIERLDRGQAHIIKRLDAQDAIQIKQTSVLDSLVISQAEQTKMLKPISDYFAFGRVSKAILVGMASLGAAVAAVIAALKGYKL